MTANCVTFSTVFGGFVTQNAGAARFPSRSSAASPPGGDGGWIG